MIVHSASGSLIGDRDENQDRYLVLTDTAFAFGAVIDGMGGHIAGAKAAQTAADQLAAAVPGYVANGLSPTAACAALLDAAHTAVSALAKPGGRRIDSPRATCALALGIDDKMAFAHVGDSRAYLIRNGTVARRTRDHSHIELLLSEGLVGEDEYRTHPLRHYVEHCLGGNPGDPSITVSPDFALEPGDRILLCSDGVWNAFTDVQLGAFLGRPEVGLTPQPALDDLLQQSVAKSAPSADNTTAVLFEWQGLNVGRARGA